MDMRLDVACLLACGPRQRETYEYRKRDMAISMSWHEKQGEAMMEIALYPAGSGSAFRGPCPDHISGIIMSVQGKRVQTKVPDHKELCDIYKSLK